MAVGRIQFRRGTFAALDLATLYQGEAYYCTDTKEIYIGHGDSTAIIISDAGDLLYTENNYITDNESLTDSVDKLDMQLKDVADADALKLPLAGGTLTGNLIMGSKNIVGATIATLADDAATSFTPGSEIGFILVYPRSSSYKEDYILAVYRTSATGFVQSIAAGTNWATTTGALAGTTGTDGKTTLSTHTDGKIYIENRSGAARSFGWVVFGT